jgi:hypothetical protein
VRCAWTLLVRIGVVSDTHRNNSSSRQCFAKAHGQQRCGRVPNITAIPQVSTTCTAFIIQGPEYLKSQRRWSLRLECMFLDEPDARVSGFLSLGSDPERPRIGRKSRYFDLWCKTNRGLPRKGQAMPWEDFLDKFYKGTDR